MKDFQDSVILYLLAYLFWMAMTMGNRVFNFVNTGSTFPRLEQIVPTKP